MGSFSAFVFHSLGVLMSYASFFYISYFYGAAVLGSLVLVITISSIFAVVPRFGFDISLIRIYSELVVGSIGNQVSAVFIKTTVFTICLSIFFVVLMLFGKEIIVHSILDMDDFMVLIPLVAIAIMTTSLLGVFGGFFRGMKKIKTFVFFNSILQPAMFLILVYAFGAQELKEVVTIFIISSVFNTIFAFFSLVYNQSKLKNNLNLTNSPIRYPFIMILSFSAPVLVSSSFAMLMLWTDVVMLGIYKTEFDVGVYSVIQKLSITIIFILGSINTIAAAKFAELFSNKNIKELKKMAQIAAKLIFYGTLPVVLIFIFFPSFILSLFGPEFKFGATALVLISIGQFVNAICGPVGFMLDMTNNQKTVRNVVIISAFINISLNYLLIPAHGINGAAFSSMVSMIFLNLCMLFAVKKRLGFWTFYMPVLK